MRRSKTDEVFVIFLAVAGLAQVAYRWLRKPSEPYSRSWDGGLSGYPSQEAARRAYGPRLDDPAMYAALDRGLQTDGAFKMVVREGATEEEAARGIAWAAHMRRLRGLN